MATDDEVKFYVGRWHGPEGNRVALIKRGRELLHVCVQDYPVTVIKMPISERRSITVLDYPVKRAARKFREFAKHDNATAAAKHLIAEALDHAD